MSKNLRWKVLVILGVVALSVFAFYPPDQKVRLGLDLKGGVHLVMRVQTDDALRLETQTTADRLAEQLKTANIPVGARHRGRAPTSFSVSGVPAEQDARVPRRADRGRSQLRPLVRRRRLHLHAQAEHRRPAARRHREPGAADDRAPRQRAGRGRADHRAPQRGRPDPGAAARRHRRQPRQGNHPLDGAAGVEAGRAGAVPGRGLGAPGAMPATCRPTSQILPGTIEGAPGQPASTGYYAVRRVAAVTGRDLRNARPTLDENNRPAVSFSLNNEGARKFGIFTQANIGKQLAIVLDSRVQSAPQIQSRIDDEGPHHRQLHEPGIAGPVADAALGRAAGVADLPRRAHGRAVARRRLDSRRRDCRRPAACCWSRCSCCSITSWPASTRSISIADQPDHAARPDGVCRRHHDAARHCRLHSHHRHGRRLERADLRAHQGRAGAPARA